MNNINIDIFLEIIKKIESFTDFMIFISTSKEYYNLYNEKKDLIESIFYKRYYKKNYKEGIFSKLEKIIIYEKLYLNININDFIKKHRIYYIKNKFYIEIYLNSFKILKDRFGITDDIYLIKIPSVITNFNIETVTAYDDTNDRTIRFKNENIKRIFQRINDDDEMIVKSKFSDDMLEFDIMTLDEFNDVKIISTPESLMYVYYTKLIAELSSLL